MNYTGQHVLVLGLGLTGLSLALWLTRTRRRRARSPTRATSRRSSPTLRRAAARRPGAPGRVRRDAVPRHRPGRDQSRAQHQRSARSPRRVARGIPIVGDIELFARELPAGAEGDRDHRLERQVDGDRADRRALPRRPACRPWSPATSACRCSTRWPTPKRAGRACPTSSCSSCRASSSRRRRAWRRRVATVLNVSPNHLDWHDGMDDYAAPRRASS